MQAHAYNRLASFEAPDVNINAGIENSGYWYANMSRDQLYNAMLGQIDFYKQSVQPGIKDMRPITFEPSSQG
jgi:hypothetical protein